MEFVYGYSGKSRNNVHFNHLGDVLYFTSRIAIVYTPSTNTQKFYTGSSSEITCSAIHPTRRIYAVGEKKKTRICVFDSETCAEISVLEVPGVNDEVESISFARKETLIAFTTTSNTVFLYDWYRKTKLAEIKLDKRVLQVEFDPKDPYTMFTSGLYYMARLQYVPGSGLSVAATSNGQNLVHLSLAVDAYNDLVYTGTRSGDICTFESNNLGLLNKFRGHNGPVFSIRGSIRKKLVFTGAKDGKVAIWNTSSGALERLHNITEVPGQIRAVDCYKGKICVGTQKNQVYIVSPTAEGMDIRVIADGHGDQVHGLTVTSDGRYMLTSSDDRSVLIWDVQERKNVGKIAINGQPRLVRFSDDESLLFVGLRDGEFYVYTVLPGHNFRLLVNRKDMRDSILEARISPSNRYLAIFFYGYSINVYDISQRGKLLKRIKTKEIPNPEISFTRDETGFIVGKSIAIDMSTWSRLRDVKNAEFVFSKERYRKAKAGIRSIELDGPVISVIDRNGNLIKRLEGHSSDVSSVVITKGGKLISVGGVDQTIIEWRYR